jgi:hypothetical protein
VERGYFLLRPVENICVTEANLASLDVSHIQPTWIVAEPHKESAIIEVRKQKFRNEHRLTLVEFLLLVDKARVLDPKYIQLRSNNLDAGG